MVEHQVTHYLMTIPEIAENIREHVKGITQLYEESNIKITEYTMSS